MKQEEIVLLAKTKLNSIEVLIFRALTGSYNSQNNFFSVNNALREYGHTKGASNILKASTVYQRFVVLIQQCLTYCFKKSKKIKCKK